MGYKLHSILGNSAIGNDTRSGAIRSARWIPAVLAAAAVIAMAVGSVSAALATSSTTITLASGVNAVSYAITGGSSGTAEFVLSPNGAWGEALGTSQWINTTGSNGSDQGDTHTTTYEATFELPAFSAASINGQVMADNAATVYLNGVQIGRQEHQSDYHPNYQEATGFGASIAPQSTTPAPFLIGSNTLRIVNVDYGGANAIDFIATVTYDPQIPVTVDFSTVTRQYDGTTSGSVAAGCTLSGVEAGDTVTCDSTGASATFDSRNAGPRTATGAGFALGGAQAWRYTISSASGSGTINPALLTVTALTNTKVADGDATAAAIPSTTGTVFANDDITGSFTESYANADAGFPKTLTPVGVVHDGNSGANYAYTYVPFSNGRIRPGPVDTLTFTSQPIDTKIGTPIYASCAPGGTPCGAASQSVEVTAKDHYGNLAGPDAPGADGTTAAIPIVVKKDTSSGVTLGPTAGTLTSNGVASFGSALVVPGTFTGTTKLYAVTGAGTGTRSTSSSAFRIVNDLAPCRGPLCKNSIGNGGTTKTLQYLFGQINTGGAYSETTLTTQFLAASLINGMCGNHNKTVNAGVELRAAGPDVTVTNNGYMVMIIPKDTLKATGIVNRGTPNFNVCVGALYLGDATLAYGSGTAPGWIAKKPTGTGTVQTTPVFDTSSGYYRYWGTPADCGAIGTSNTDPCIALRTKQKSDITALINQGILAVGADANVHDADLVIVIKKPSPWDGRGGVY